MNLLEKDTGTKSTIHIILDDNSLFSEQTLNFDMKNLILSCWIDNFPTDLVLGQSQDDLAEQTLYSQR